MKSFKKLLTAVGAVMMAFMMTFAVGCNEKEQRYNPEEQPLVMSLNTPDGVFNPFFSTSAMDSTVLGMTQVSMLGSDEKGSITCGENEPVVVQDWTSTYDKTADKTTYKFIIKNGMKFSDGEPLTIRDVLFNLYVYLDPVYTGSSTIYSTDIVGLAAYRTQNPDASDKSSASFEETFVNRAYERIDDLVQFMRAYGIYSPTLQDDPKPGKDAWENDAAKKAERQQDFVTVAKTFREELITDWNTTDSNMETYKKWRFTEVWQAFLLNDGGLTEFLQTEVATGGGTKYKKDEEGNYYLDTEETEVYQKLLDAYLSAKNVTENSANYKTTVRDWAVNTVYGMYFPDAVDINTDYDEKAFDVGNIASTIAGTDAKQFEPLVRHWMTADTVRDLFAAKAKSDYFDGVARNVPNITGIRVDTPVTTDYHRNNLGEPHDVLSITINGIDPKAIWNFAFTVAPMHYYSGTWGDAKHPTKDYVDAFKKADITSDKNTEFGLEYSNIDFMNAVVNAPEKNKLPKGAGVYKASTVNGGDAQNGSQFYTLNWIYYERNPYFETMGEKIHNAIIKRLQYKVVESDQIINSLITKEIHIGEPSATYDNQRALDSHNIKHVEIQTAGYGYIGVNPRFVPNINVRRAIMKAMDVESITTNYYQGGFAETIYRPMSKASWAYPTSVTTPYVSENGTDYKFDPIGDEIEKLVKDAGYTLNRNGVYEKQISGFGTDTLDYEFTIAGSTSDHPAYSVFLKAARLLNNHGFSVKVSTSQTALSDLASGKLAVWAAAWSSTIDPDMYQVYHMDSLATSVNNWGYKQIKANKKLYATEWSLVQRLSTQIDLGRQTDVQKDRKEIYATALNLVMELAVELPTYQRKDMTAFDSDLIDVSTMTPEKKRSAYNGLISRIWELNYN